MTQWIRVTNDHDTLDAIVNLAHVVLIAVEYHPPLSGGCWQLRLYTAAQLESDDEWYYVVSQHPDEDAAIEALDQLQQDQTASA
jgi:hypothetical protein